MTIDLEQSLAERHAAAAKRFLPPVNLVIGDEERAGIASVAN